ncbi:MAG: FAD-dependent oxidoreductase [Verrucomicrobia bacterium]|nr:FAD-dependent oxidoreductase [Verrucomicrobiota bacterium]
MNRTEAIRAISDRSTKWDCLVIGGGATGLGTAVEAAARGLKTLLVERFDFAQGTSSRSTKLAHGGVRYLEQGNITLVRAALRERGLMLQNAPHLVHALQFVIPAYHLWQLPFYGVGLKIYDFLSGKLSLGHSKVLSRSETLNHLPTLETRGLKGGILYMDGQFDDSRLAISLALTFWDLGGTIANYVEVVDLTKQNGKVSGAIVRDRETSSEHEVAAKIVVNATGVFVDAVRRLDEPDARKLLAVSQGAHLVLPREFLPSRSALMIPKTSDGRVLFGIPWHDRLIIGTTDHEVPEPIAEPTIQEDEIHFMLTESAKYFDRDPSESDVLSCYVGLRPLVRAGEGSSTAALSRDHTVIVSTSGLITITGGKWTTYRHMAEDCIDHVCDVGGVARSPSRTTNLPLHGSSKAPEIFSPPEHLAVYGAEREKVTLLAASNGFGELVHPRLPYLRAEVLWAVREEMARTVEDVLSRRTRALLLDSAAAVEAAPWVAELLAAELGRDQSWQADQVKQFCELARSYQIRPSA